MNLVDFMTWVKREGRYGGSPVISGPAAAGDLPTLDILLFTNARLKRIWRKATWPWTYEQLKIAVVPGTVVYSVATVSGRKIDRIENLIPNDATANPPVMGDPLVRRTERRFAKESRSSYYSVGAGGGPASPTTGVPRIYKLMGLDANGFWQFQLYPSPSSPFTMGGSGKALMNTFLIGDVTGQAPFSAGNVAQAINPPFAYFPDGIVDDVLFKGVMSDVKRITGDDARADALDREFEDAVKLLAAEEANVDKDDTPPTTALPRLIQRRVARRMYRGRW